MSSSTPVDKRTKIIQTALELFVNQGLQQTSMAQLSKVSGVAVGTMYHHFKSKDELIIGIFLFIQEDFGNFVKLRGDELEFSYREQFDRVFRKSYEYYTQHPNYFFFVDMNNYSPVISTEITLQGREYYQQTIDLLMQGIKEGTFIPIHPNQLIRWVYNSIISLVQIKLCDDVEVTDDMIDQTIGMLWNALR